MTSGGSQVAAGEKPEEWRTESERTGEEEEGQQAGAKCSRAHD